MHEQLEAELGEFFTTRAATVPPDVAARLRSIDFNPRPARRSPRVTVVSLAGAAAATGTVVSVMVLGGAQPAFAGWRAAPTQASSSQSATADQNCQAQITQSPAAAGTTAADWTPVATDVRGPYTVIVYQDGTSFATCFNGPSFTVMNAESPGNGNGHQSSSGSVHVGSGSGAGSGTSSVAIGTYTGSDPNGVVQMTVSHLDLDAASGGPYTLVEGQIGSGVTGVTLVRGDGQDVVATTGGGWFVAWWPGTEDISSAQVTTPSGQTSETFNQGTMTSSPPALPTPGSVQCSPAPTMGSCSSGSSSGAPAAP